MRCVTLRVKRSTNEVRVGEPQWFQENGQWGRWSRVAREWLVGWLRPDVWAYRKQAWPYIC